MGNPKKRIQYRYDAVGNRVGMTAPDGGRFTYAYDVMNRLSSLQNPQGERTTYQYDAIGRRTLTLLASGSRTSTTYDAGSRVTGVANLKSNGSVQTSFAYAYDDSGNRTRVIDADGRRTTWSYDAASQLTGEHRGGTGGYRHTFTYDAAGNRTLKQEDGQRTTYVYDDANQLSYSHAAAGRTTYVYDADGNQALTIEPTGARTTYVWDYENRMSRALLPSGLRNTMAYDPDGLRVKLEESTGTKKFVWDDQNYLAQTDANNDTQVEYTSEPRTYGNLISHRQGGATTYYQFDALGSTRALANASEVLLATYDYGAWGTLLGSPTLLTPFLWVGRVGYHWDAEAQNQYVRARYYRPTVARWFSIDIAFPYSGWNWFAYAELSPPNTQDPSGWKCEKRDMGTVKYVPRGVFRSATIGLYDASDDSGAYQRVGSKFTAWWAPNQPLAASPFESIDPATGSWCCCCDSVGLVQIVKEEYHSLYFNRSTEWQIDGGFPYPKGSQSSPCPNTHKKTQQIKMMDMPNFSRTIFSTMLLFRQDFEVCAMCIAPGTLGDEGYWTYDLLGFPYINAAIAYGCLKWGHEIVTSPSRRWDNVNSGETVPYEVKRRYIEGTTGLHEVSSSISDGTLSISDDPGVAPSAAFRNTVIGYFL